jgi:hypothetical protein
LTWGREQNPRIRSKIANYESHFCHAFDSQKFLAGAPKRAQVGGMKTLAQNIVPFVLQGLPPLNKLDQSMMRKLRKLADHTDSTVEDLIHEGMLEFVAKQEAEKKLETKVIRFPTPVHVAYKAKIK